MGAMTSPTETHNAKCSSVMTHNTASAWALTTHQVTENSLPGSRTRNLSIRSATRYHCASKAVHCIVGYVEQ
eukprot:15365210-Ditylum_brightwellii.AAC.2